MQERKMFCLVSLLFFTLFKIPVFIAVVLTHLIPVSAAVILFCGVCMCVYVCARVHIRVCLPWLFLLLELLELLHLLTWWSSLTL